MGRSCDHLVSTFVLHSPAQLAAEAGVNVEAVLSRHGIAAESLEEFGARAPAYEAMSAWAELAASSGDAQFGLRLATREPVGTYDVLGYIVRSSEDLGRGIQQLLRYQRLLGDGVRIGFHTNDSCAALTHQLLVPVGERRHIVEHDLGLLAIRAREFTRAEWCARAVSFRHEPPATSGLYAEIFGGPVRFGQLSDALAFDRATLAWPLRNPDARLSVVLERYATDALARHPLPDEFVARVHAAVAELLPSASVTAPGVAARVHVSPRTLQRHLAGEHTSLREVVDAVRRELAEEYLAQRWMSLEDIALLLGFADARSFARAFRRWTGRAPVHYRREPPPVIHVASAATALMRAVAR